MKRLQKLKLTEMNKSALETKAMRTLKGGWNCRCNHCGSPTPSTIDNEYYNIKGDYDNNWACNSWASAWTVNVVVSIIACRM